MSNKFASGKSAVGKAEGLSMLDVVLLDGINKHSGRQNYAASLGITYRALHGWLYGSRDPLYRPKSRAKIEADSGLSEDHLRRLQDVSAKEGLDIVSEHIKNLDPLEQENKSRFMALVEEKGSEIPAAAYAIYLTGKLPDRQKLVTLLESDEMPPAMPVEALQFTLNQLPTPRPPQ